MAGSRRDGVSERGGRFPRASPLEIPKPRSFYPAYIDRACARAAAHIPAPRFGQAIRPKWLAYTLRKNFKPFKNSVLYVFRKIVVDGLCELRRMRPPS